MAGARGSAVRSGGGQRGRGGGPQRLDARAVAQLLDQAGESRDPVCVVSGPEEALRRLVVTRILDGAHDAGATVVRVSATDHGAADAVRHAGDPTLFGGATWLLLTDLDQAGEEVIAAAKEAVAAASPQERIVLSHSGAQRGRGVITAAEKAGGRMFSVHPVAGHALEGVLTWHAKRAGRVLTGDAAAAIIAALGQDLTVLLARVEQLASDASGGTIDLELVRATLVAAGSENQFEIADLVWRRRTAPALHAFRQLADRNGAASACVTVVAALSYSLRSLARYVAERPSGSRWQVASALGVPAWKVDVLAAQAKLWRPAELAHATVLLARADADSKGGLGDAGALDLQQKLYAVERLIVQLSAAPSGEPRPRSSGPA